MKNKEKYQNEICNVIATGRHCNFKHRFIIKKDTCQGLSCDECQELTKKWFDEEYKEPIKLTLHEKCILESIDKKYQWIARDRKCSLYVHESKPFKYSTYWDSVKQYECFIFFNHLFQFIKWEDEEPRNIQELLENCEVIEDD